MTGRLPETPRGALLCALGATAGCAPEAPEAGVCPTWEAPAAAGVVDQPALTEASGVVESPLLDGVLWTHNDGDDGVLYAISDAGEALGALSVSPGTATDWEDVGAALIDDQSWLVAADIGDNDGSRDAVSVAWVPEPDDPAADGEAAVVTVRTVSLEAGPVDAEALVVDPRDARPYLLTREEGRARLIALPGLDGGVEEAAPVGDVVLPDGVGSVRGADLTPDASRLYVRTTNAVLVYLLDEDTSLREALLGEPCRAPAPDEADGEAIAAVAGGFVTVSEGASPTLWRVSEAP